MKKTSSKIVFFGNERLATGVTTEAPTLQALVAAGYDVVAVVSNYEPAQSRNTRSLEIATVAKRFDIPVLLPDTLGAIQEQLRDYEAAAGILVAYGKLIPQGIIDLFPRGIINIHPSLLPLYRGPTPIEQAILDGATETGVSIMQLAKEMDAGPVFARISVNLSGKESKQQLADTLLRLGGELLLEHLSSILEGSVFPAAQDDTQATYSSLLSKNDGIVDWHKPAEQIEREIRAFIEWPKSRTVIGGKEVIITRASVDRNTEYGVRNKGEAFITPDKQLAVPTGAEVLIIERLKPAGKREMSTSEFLAGYRL